mmetsp:Transcript_2929/g.6639  ORF Transcript_2929/g.6639 Transcript_2929/m.6639 type:complete len:242 (-) Transcript_2929:8-733(-)
MQLAFANHLTIQPPIPATFTLATHVQVQGEHAMCPAGVLVQVGLIDMTAVGGPPQHLLQILDACHGLLGKVLHLHSCSPFQQAQWDNLNIREQIRELVVVKAEETASDSGVHVLRVLQPIEDYLRSAQNHPAPLLTRDVTLDTVGLACAGLPVRQHAGLVATQGIVDHWPQGLIKHLGLVCLFVKNAVEAVRGSHDTAIAPNQRQGVDIIHRDNLVEPHLLLLFTQRPHSADHLHRALRHS